MYTCSKRLNDFLRQISPQREGWVLESQPATNYLSFENTGSDNSTTKRSTIDVTARIIEDDNYKRK